MLTLIPREPPNLEKPDVPIRGPLFVRLPWAWDALVFAVPFADATRDAARDLVWGAAPSVVSNLVWTKDNRGNPAANLATNSYIDYPDNPAHNKPATAITAYVRFRRAGTGELSSGLLVKSYDASSFLQSWGIMHADPGGNILASNIYTGTDYYWESSYVVPTTSWTSAFLRWRSGAEPRLDVLSERGTVLASDGYGSAVSGSVAYNVGEALRLNGNNNPATNFNADYSQAMVWARVLTDTELQALVADPFGWYSPRKESLVTSGPPLFGGLAVLQDNR